MRLNTIARAGGARLPVDRVAKGAPEAISSRSLERFYAAGSTFVETDASTLREVDFRPR